MKVATNIPIEKDTINVMARYVPTTSMGTEVGEPK